MLQTADGPLFHFSSFTTCQCFSERLRTESSFRHLNIVHTEIRAYLSRLSVLSFLFLVVDIEYCTFFRLLMQYDRRFGHYNR